MNYDDWKADNEPTRAQLEERVSELEAELAAEREARAKVVAEIRNVAGELPRHRTAAGAHKYMLRWAADLVEGAKP